MFDVKVQLNQEETVNSKNEQKAWISVENLIKYVRKMICTNSNKSDYVNTLFLLR